MLRLIIQTKRRYKKIEQHKVKNNEDIKDIDSSCTNDESEDRKSNTSHNGQDSDVSFEMDNDEEIDAAEIEEEEWVEYTKRSTIEAIEKMENKKIRCWKLTQRKMKWKLAMRIATSQKERWLIKAAEWNPELSSKYRTNRSIDRPSKRWEDDINEFLKQIEDETENLTESSNQINKTWINTAKDRGRWTLLEENYTKNSVTRTRRDWHNRPARSSPRRNSLRRGIPTGIFSGRELQPTGFAYKWVVVQKEMRVNTGIHLGDPLIKRWITNLGVSVRLERTKKTGRRTKETI